MLGRLGVAVNVIAPLGATPADLARLGDASFNIVLYPETGLQAASWLSTFVRPEDDKDGADRGRRHPGFHCRSC